MWLGSNATIALLRAGRAGGQGRRAERTLSRSTMETVEGTDESCEITEDKAETFQMQLDISQSELSVYSASKLEQVKNKS